MAQDKTPGDLDPSEHHPRFVVHSAETYVHEPADLWTSRLEGPWKDLAFRLERKEIEGDEGTHERFVWTNTEGRPLAGKGEAGRGRLDASTAQTLLSRLDAEGITGAVLYPSITHRCYSLCVDTDQLDAFLDCYNDWILELVAEAPDRLKAVCLVNVDHPRAAQAKMRALSQRGAAAFVIPMSPGYQLRYDMPQYEALWETSDELKKPLVMMAGSMRNTNAEHAESRRKAFEGNLVAQLSHQATGWFAARRSITAIIFTGAFERYPDFRLGIVGYGAGWAPFAMVRGDEMQQVRPERTGPPTRVPNWVADAETIKQTMHLRQIADVAIDASKRSGTVGMAPEGVGFYFEEGDSFSNHFKKGVFLTFTLKGRLSLVSRGELGKHGLLWGHRFPAPEEGDIPSVQERLGDALSAVGPDDKQRLVSDNTAQLFGF